MRAWRTRLRRFGPLLGLVLLIAALVMVWRQRAIVSEALAAVGAQSPETLWFYAGVLVLTVIVNIACTAGMFNLLLRRCGRVGWLEMQALIAASTLLNYVPLRPGLFGRVAYHRLYNQIAVADSIRAVVQAIGLSFTCVTILGLGIAIAGESKPGLWMVSLGPLALFAAIAAGFGIRRPRGSAWPIALAAAVRYFDLLATAMRYHAAFALIGSPIEFQQAAAFACIAVLATMVPFLSNGLGLREWAIGLASPWLRASQLELALTADLLIRAAEIVVIIPAGFAGVVYLARLRRQRDGNADNDRSPTAPSLTRQDRAR